jgi:serine/threonine protein kinase
MGNGLIGQSFGHYQILEQLGEGGMATVYKAYDTRLERKVAIKVIRTEKLAQETIGRALKRFEREAKALAKLNHPNIVQVIDYGEHQDKPYLVMPLLEGGTLKTQIREGGIPWLKSTELVHPIALALEYAHQLKIIHRDIKPSNILITQTGDPMLSDFGIAKILDIEETGELTGTGIGLGTPEYMSPEQFEGRADARTDIYALGVVLYEMVTGRKPYMAETPAGVIIKQATGPLPRPKQFARDLPDAFEKILFKALAKKPDDRFQNMGQFATALEQIILVYKQQKVRNIRRNKSIDTAVKSHKLTAGNLARMIRSVGSIKPTPKQIRTFWALTLALAAFFGLNWFTGQPSSSGSSFLPALQAVLPFGATSTPTATSTPIPTSTRTSTPTHIITQTPSITPTPVYMEGNILFEEDFEDNGIEGWKFGSYILNSRNPSQYWSIQQDTDGNSLLFGSVVSSDETGFAIGSSNWINYMIEFRSKVLVRGEDVNFQGFGVSLRNSEDRGCPLAYELGFGRWWFLGKTSGPGDLNGHCPFRHLVEAPEKGIALEKWYQVKIVAYDTAIKSYIDGSLIHNIIDSSSQNGGVGISISNGAQVYFDDIKITKLLPR